MSTHEAPKFQTPHDEQLWRELKSVVDSRGEFGDPYAEYGVVRKASIVFAESKAELHVAEVMDPNDLEGPLAYRMERSDQRGDFEVMVSAVTALGEQAVRVAMYDVEAYRGATEESMKRWQATHRHTIGAWKAVLRQRNNGVTPEVPTQRLLDMYRTHGLGRADKKQLTAQLKAEGYNDDDVTLVLRVASQDARR